MNKKNNKLRKITTIIIFNIIAICLLWFLSDICLYITSLKLNNQLSFQNLKKFYTKPYNPIKSINYFFDIQNNNSDENVFRTRKPYGLIYKAHPILLFGCSYAYGLNLNYNQIFSYKLSQQTKRPVYNRAMPGQSFQFMYYQTTTDEFYKSVPPSDTIFYILLDDHLRRMFGETFFIFEPRFYMHYKYKDYNFKINNFNEPFVIFYKYNYTLRAIRKLYNSFYLNNSKNYDKITDEALAYFIKTRENLQNHWHKNFKFIIFIYQPNIHYDNLRLNLISKLLNNGFIVVKTDDLTKEDLYSKKYRLIDNHPNEAAWDLLTPL
ncbi:hypothetical protein IJG14_01620, partial [bacterium]|nr:hypothetical protein [bacterium]